jgi:hypothetical protein
MVNGRFVIDEPTELPEGTELYLVPVSEEDEDLSCGGSALAPTESFTTSTTAS